MTNSSESGTQPNTETQQPQQGNNLKDRFSSILKRKLSKGQQRPTEAVLNAIEETQDSQEPLTISPLPPSEMKSEIENSDYVGHEKGGAIRKTETKATREQQIRGEIARIQHVVKPYDTNLKGIDRDVYKFKYDRDLPKQINPNLPEDIRQEIEKRFQSGIPNILPYDEDKIRGTYKEKPVEESKKELTPEEMEAEKRRIFGEKISKLNKEQAETQKRINVKETKYPNMSWTEFQKIYPDYQELQRKIAAKEPLKINIPAESEKIDNLIKEKQPKNDDWEKFREDEKKKQEFIKNPPADRLHNEDYYAYAARKKFEKSPPDNWIPGESRDEYFLRGGPEELQQFKQQAEEERRRAKAAARINPFASKNPRSPAETRELIAVLKEEEEELAERKKAENEVTGLLTPKTKSQESAWAKLRNKLKRKEPAITTVETAQDEEGSGEFEIGGKNWEERLIDEQRKPRESLSWPSKWGKSQEVTDTTPPPTQPETSPDDDTLPFPQFALRRRQLKETQPPAGSDNLKTTVSKDKLLERQEDLKGNNSNDALYERLTIDQLEETILQLVKQRNEVYDPDIQALIRKAGRIQENKKIELGVSLIKTIQENGITPEVASALIPIFPYDNLSDIAPQDIIDILHGMEGDIQNPTIKEDTKAELQAKLKALQEKPWDNTDEINQIKNELTTRDKDTAWYVLDQYRRGDPIPMNEVLMKLTGSVPENLTPELFEEILLNIARNTSEKESPQANNTSETDDNEISTLKNHMKEMSKKYEETLDYDYFVKSMILDQEIARKYQELALQKLQDGATAQEVHDFLMNSGLDTFYFLPANSTNNVDSFADMLQADLRTTANWKDAYRFKTKQELLDEKDNLDANGFESFNADAIDSELSYRQGAVAREALSQMDSGKQVNMIQVVKMLTENTPEQLTPEEFKQILTEIIENSAM